MIQHDPVRVRLRRAGEFSRRLAWGIESVAVVIGLLTAVGLGLDAYASAGGQIAFTAVLLGSGGFLIVSMAELTKIPVATALFHSRGLWRLAITGLLLLLGTITFETVFFSLERGFTLRMFAVERTRQTLELQESDRAALARQLDSAAAVTGTTSRDLEAQLEARRRGPVERIKSAEAELARLGEHTMSGEVLELKRQEERLAGEREQLVRERDDEIRRLEDNFRSQRDSYVQRIEQAGRDGNKRYAEQMQKSLAALRSPRAEIDRIREEFGGRLLQREEAIEALRIRLAQLQSAPDPGLSQRRSDLQIEIDQARTELRALDSEFAESARRLANERMSDHEAGRAAEQRIAELDRAITEGEHELARVSELSQVHRIAAVWYQKAPAALTSAEAKTVASFWFGSIALLAGLAGPAMAVLSQCLLAWAERPAGPRPLTPAAKLAHALRRLVVKWRFRRIRTIVQIEEKPVEVFVDRPVEVPVEVKVEVPVDRPVEVIVEKEIKQFVYVPVPASDPQRLLANLERDIPADIVDLVRMRMAGAEHDRAA